jgi:hypothetical protein
MTALVLKKFSREFVKAQLAAVEASSDLLRETNGTGRLQTIGLPLYQSLETPSAYRAHVRNDTETMIERFEDMHSAVREELEEFLSAPVNFHPRAAVPGFHCFRLGLGESYPGGGAHFDLSHFDLPLLPHERVDESLALDAAISFTLPLALPISGAALEQWPLSYAAYKRQIDHQPLAGYAAENPSTLTKYLVGALYVYPAYLLHQIAPIKQATRSQRRITYQGHCVRISGKWTMYW